MGSKSVIRQVGQLLNLNGAVRAIFEENLLKLGCDTGYWMDFITWPNIIGFYFNMGHLKLMVIVIVYSFEIVQKIARSSTPQKVTVY